MPAILSGDWRQHGSVERGGVLRLLETQAGLKPATISTIQRQKGAYKDAVASLADGKLSEGFEQLERLGWVQELPDETRDATIAKVYLEAIRFGDSALVIAPTHREAAHLSDAIRATLQTAGELADESLDVERLVPLHFTEAERRDAASYQVGDVIVFHQNAAGHRKGDRIVVEGVPSGATLGLAERFAVYRRETLPIAFGERLRITAGGVTLDRRHRLNTGDLRTVRDFTPQGDVVLDNGWTVSKDFGHWSHGYVQTSHAAQGSTVDRVLISESAESFAAASQEQFYVSVSRGRKEARVFTDDRLALRAAVQESSAKLTASEFVQGQQPQVEARRRRIAHQTIQRERERTQEPVKEARHGKV